MPGLRSKLAQNRFRPTEQKKLSDKHDNEIGVGQGDSSLNTGAFDAHRQGRAQSIQDINDAKIPSGDLINEKLSKAADQNASARVKTKIDSVFALPAAGGAPSPYLDAQTKYNDSVVVFNELVKTIPTEHKARDFIGAMKKITDEASQAIKAQHDTEKQKLNDLFNNDRAFKDDLNTTLGVTDADHDKIKESMVKSLDAKHKKQLEDFDKTAQDSRTKILQSASEEVKRFRFIAEMQRSGSVEFVKHIEELAKKNRNAHGGGATGLHLGKRKAIVSTANLKQLEFLELLGGKRIGIKEGPDGKKIYSIDLGSAIRNPFYRLFGREQQDLQLMAAAIRASGATSINIKITADTPELAEKKARAAYEACIRSGFPPDKIKIELTRQKLFFAHQASAEKDSQKVESIQEKLFGKHAGDYQKLDRVSKEIQEEIKNVGEHSLDTPGVGIQALTNKIQDKRAEIAAARDAAAAAARAAAAAAAPVAAPVAAPALPGAGNPP